MQQILAILAPALDDVTPAQRARAHRATMEQMMLLARGYSVDSQAVRCAAAMVGSALSADPVEFELAAVPELSAAAASLQATGTAGAGWQRSEQYARYLRTVLATQRSLR